MSDDDEPPALPARAIASMRAMMHRFAGVAAPPAAAAAADSGPDTDSESGTDEKVCEVDGVHFRGTLVDEEATAESMARVFAASAERLAATMAAASAATAPYHLQLRTALPGPPFVIGRDDAGLAAADTYLSRLERVLLSLPPAVAAPVRDNASGALINALRAATDDTDTDTLLDGWTAAVTSISDLQARITRHCCGSPSSRAARLYRALLAALPPASPSTSTHAAASRLVQLLRRCRRAAPAVFRSLLVVEGDLARLLAAALALPSRDRFSRWVGTRRGFAFKEQDISRALRARVTGLASDSDADCDDAYSELLEDLETDRRKDGARTGAAAPTGHRKQITQASPAAKGAKVSTNATLASAFTSPSTHRALPPTGKGRGPPRAGGRGGGGDGGRDPSGRRPARSSTCVYCGTDGHEMWQCPDVEAKRPPAVASTVDNPELFALRVRTRLLDSVARVADQAAGGGPRAGAAHTHAGWGAHVAAAAVAPPPARDRFGGGGRGNGPPDFRVNVSLCAATGHTLPGVHLTLADAAYPRSGTPPAFSTLTVVDTASSAALLVNEEYATGAEWVQHELDPPATVTGVNGAHSLIHRTVHLSVTGDFMDGGCRSVVALLVPGLAYPAILGLPLLRASGAALDFRSYAFFPGGNDGSGGSGGGGSSGGGRGDGGGGGPLVDASPGGVRDVPVPVQRAGADSSRDEAAGCDAAAACLAARVVEERGQEVPPPQPPPKARDSLEDIMSKIEVPITKEEAATIKRLYTKSASLFVPNAKGLFRLKPTTLVLDPDQPPVACRAYELSRRDKRMVEGHVHRLVSKGLATRTSEHCRWAAPAFVVPKVDNPGDRLEDYRFVINYKGSVNAALLSDPYPSPCAEDIIADLAGWEVYSGFDLAKAYDQCWLEVGPSREAAAFVCHMGTYVSNVVSLGLTTAPAIFARAIHEIIGDRFEELAGVLRSFFDDVFAGDRTVAEQLIKIEKLFDLFIYHNVQLSPGKEVWLRRALRVLGRMCSRAGISPVPATRCALADAPLPSSCKVLNSYLGLAVFLYRHAPGAAQLAARVRAAIGRAADGKRQLRWSEDSKAAFRSLQLRFADADCLAKPVTGEPFFLFVDAMLANDGGFGAVLVQHGAVVSFASVCFGDDPAFSALSIREAEAGAMLWAHRVFERVIIGSHVTVLSDSKNLLAQLRHGPGSDPRYRRLVAALAEYGSTYRHVSTEANLADLLSRLAPHLIGHSAADLQQGTAAGGAGQGDVLRSSHPLVPLPVELLPRGCRSGLPLDVPDCSGERPASVHESTEFSANCSGEPASVHESVAQPGAATVSVLAALASEDAGQGGVPVPPLAADIRHRLKSAATAAGGGGPLDTPSPWLAAQMLDDFCLAVRLALFLERDASASERADWSARAGVAVRLDTLSLDRPLERFEVARGGALVVSPADSVDSHRRVVVPAGRVASVLSDLHGIAHRGAEACYNDADANFFWPGMRRDVEEFTRACPVCVAHRSKRPGRAGMLSFAALQATRPPTPWSTVYCDTIKLSTDGRYTAALVVTCAETGAVAVHPISSPCADECVPWLFSEVIDRYSVLHLITDGGPEFRNAAFAAAVAARGPALTHVFSAPGHAAGNGKAERTVQWLRAACATLPRGASWVAALADIRNSYNNSAQEAGVAPFSLVTGRPVRAPGGAVASAPSSVRLSALRGWAAAWRREQAVRRAAHFNRSRFLVQFISGELVMRWKGERVSKLTARFDGPYRIVRVIRDGTYELEAVATSQQPRRNARRRVAHVSALRRYSGSHRDGILLRAVEAGADETDAPAAAAAVSADLAQRSQAAHPGAIAPADTFDIDHVVGYSFNSTGDLLFRIRWVGFGPSSDTLEPYVNVHESEVFRNWLEAEFRSNPPKPAPRRRRRRRQA